MTDLAFVQEELFTGLEISGVGGADIEASIGAEIQRGQIGRDIVDVRVGHVIEA